MDKQIIKRMVLDIRYLLEEDITAVLRQYGLFTDRSWLPIEQVRSELRHARMLMEVAMQPELARINESQRDLKKAQQSTTAWYIREVAFTYLNRLVGLKCLEVRGLFPEVIQTRIEYGGRSIYHRDFLDANPQFVGQPDDGLCAMLKDAFAEVTRQIRYLFDPNDNASIVWPRYIKMREAIDHINELPAAYWLEDEIIGWIYQFYNTKEKGAIRDRREISLPIEVAIINQFFTPRWVVKFLVDNTLGRLWLEMCPNSPRVRAKCDYLLPEFGPLTGEEVGPGENGGQYLALEMNSPINNSSAISARIPKLPQDLKLIDPACGTMHFGHYAFEVFTAIYQDARECKLVAESAFVSDKDIPLMILKYNLYGVDIDLRAVQLAALSLYLKARVALHDMGIDNASVVDMSWQVNLVCADAHLPGEEQREQFLDQYEDDPVLQQAWRELFKEMEDIAQMGSLLRVEKRFKALLRQHNPSSVILRERQQSYLPGLEPPVRQLTFAEVEADWSPHRSLQTMLEHLQIFARTALETADVNAQLFVAEAEKTISLIDVLMQGYDVVVMNPPFGNLLTDKAKVYLANSYKISNINLLCAFLERGQVDLVQGKGLTGAIVDKTFLLKMNYRKFREQILLTKMRLLALVDLGWQILDDAQVEVVMMVLGPVDGVNSPASCFRLDKSNNRKVKLEEMISSLQSNHNYLRDDFFVINPQQFRHFPNASFAYWIPKSLLKAFQQFPALDPAIAYAREGVHPLDAERFTRFHWEVSKTDIGMGQKWVSFANGGGYSPFYRDNDKVILWEKEGYAISNYIDNKGKVISGMRNPQLQFQKGLTYGKRTDYLSVQKLEAGHVFSHEGLGIFPKSEESTWHLLALLNSNLVRYMINTMCGQHKLSGYTGQLPYAEPLPEDKKKLAKLAIEGYEIRKEWDMGSEPCTRFDKPRLLKTTNGERKAAFSLPYALDELENQESSADARIKAIENEIDEIVYRLYDVSSTDRFIIEQELDKRPATLIWPQMENKSALEKRKEHIRSLLSYFLLESLKATPDGIIPLAEGTGNATATDQLRRALEEYFGESVALQLEDEAARLLGKSLSLWLNNDYFKWHTQLYKNRPIIWHLASESNTFGCLLYYHALDHDTLQKVRKVYLRPLFRRLESEGYQISEQKNLVEASANEVIMDELRVFDEKLAALIDAGYHPHWDDGVKPNILPLQEMNVLSLKKVV